MPKPTKADMARYRKILVQQLAELTGDVGSLRDEALRSTEGEGSTDNPADLGSDTWDQGFMLGLIENEEETIRLIQEAIERLDDEGDFPYGQCARCVAEAEAGERKKADTWIPKQRISYIPWARHCVKHQEEFEQSRESA